MKKLIALLLSLIMILGMAACTPETTDGDEGNVSISMPDAVISNPGQVNADVYPLKTDTKLRVMFNEDATSKNEAVLLWEEKVGVEIDLVTWSHEQMLNSLAADDVPDVIVMPWDFTKEQVWENAQAGRFINFLDYLDKMPNLCALIKEYPQILEVCAYPDGGMYSLPKVGWSNTLQSNLLYIRTDIMEELGWEKAPATTDQLLQFIKEAQAKYNDNPEFIAFVPQTKNYMEWNTRNAISTTLFPCFGELIETGLTLNSDGEVVLGAATEQYRYYLEFMNEIWTSGAFATEVYTMDSATGKAIIQNGNCAISIGTSAPATSFADGVQHVAVMEPLTSKYSSTKQWMKDPIVTFRGCVVSSKCEDLDTALAFVDSFYATEDNPLDKEGTVWGYSVAKGVLGKNWTIDEENNTWISGANFGGFSDALYSGNNTLIPVGTLTVKGAGTNENLLPYAVESYKLQTNIVLSGDDQDDFADLWNDLNKYIGQMHGKFITGAEDLESGWDNYLNQLNKMGLEEVLEIYQNAYAPAN